MPGQIYAYALIFEEIITDLGIAIFWPFCFEHFEKVESKQQVRGKIFLHIRLCIIFAEKITDLGIACCFQVQSKQQVRGNFLHIRLCIIFRRKKITDLGFAIF